MREGALSTQQGSSSIVERPSSNNLVQYIENTRNNPSNLNTKTKGNSSTTKS